MKNIKDFTSKMKDKDLATLFSNCLPNTLDTTVYNFTIVDGIPDTFVVTGDIHMNQKKEKEKKRKR